MESAKQPDTFSYILIVTLLALLTYAGFISYKSIDYDILKKLEAMPLNIPAAPTSAISTQSAKTNDQK